MGEHQISCISLLLGMCVCVTCWCPHGASGMQGTVYGMECWVQFCYCVVFCSVKGICVAALKAAVLVHHSVMLLWCGRRSVNRKAHTPDTNPVDGYQLVATGEETGCVSAASATQATMSCSCRAFRRYPSAMCVFGWWMLHLYAACSCCQKGTMGFSAGASLPGW